MPSWAGQAADVLWQSALGAVPLALLAACICRCLPARPATRHFIWLIVLLRFVTPSLTSPLASTTPSDAPQPAAAVDAAEAATLPDERRAQSGSPESDSLPTRIAERPYEDGASLLTTRPGSLSLPFGSLIGLVRMAEGADAAVPDVRKVTPAGPRVLDPLAPAPVSGGGSSPPTPDGHEEPPFYLVASPAARRLDAPFLDASTLNPAAAEAVVPPWPDAADARPALDSTFAHISEPPVSIEAVPAAGALVLRTPEFVSSCEARTAGTPTSTLDGAAGALLRAWRSARGSGRELLGRLLAGRDALYALPRIPPPVWAAGASLVLVLFFSRVLWCAALLRGARPVTGRAAQAIAEGARGMGLRCVPRAYFVDRAISPMVLCWRTPRLLLPTCLWKDLDAAGRQAVIYHELAHLKRRDHWVLWIESLVAAVYWWNPVVWWVRRRLREEADLCCDSWVMCLMPRERRAYAETLLLARRIVDDRDASMSGVGMAMTSGRARRLARRIKMIMTEKARPRLSAPGLMLGLVLALGAWMASPASSCPPGKKKDKGDLPKPPAMPAPAEWTVVVPEAQSATVETAAFSLHGVVAPDPVCPPSDSTPATLTVVTPKPPAAGAAAPMARVPEAPSASLYWPANTMSPVYVTASGEDRRLEERMKRLEEQMQRLQRQLEDLSSTLGAKSGATRALLESALAAEPANPELHKALSGALSAAGEAVDGAGRAASTAVESALRNAYVAGGLTARTPLLPQGAIAAAPAAGPGQIVVRAYKLPEGKLDAVVNLMIRDDVPVRVRRDGDKIEVHATPLQHDVFAAFVALINERADREKAYRLPQGKLQALTELMARDDVPVTVSPGGDALTVHGDDLEQRVFEAFIHLIHPEGEGLDSPRTAPPAEPSRTPAPPAPKGRTGLRTSRDPQVLNESAPDAARAEEIIRRAQEEISAIEAQRQEAESRMRELQQKAREIEKQARTLDREAEELRRQAEDTRTLAERLDSEERRRAMEEARDLQREADALASRAEDMRDEAEAVHDEAELIETEVLALRERSRTSREQLRTGR